MSQQDFWPEEIKIRNVDRVDVFSLAEDDNILMLYHKLLEKSWTYNDIQEGKYFIYPTGGHNPFLPEKGKVFPYLFNEVTKKIIKPADRRNTLINVYPAWKLKTKKGLVDVYCHVLVAKAFIINDNPKLKGFVDHKKNNVSDYRIKSLAWASGSNNMEKALKKKPGYKIDLLKEELEREIKREEERKKIYK